MQYHSPSSLAKLECGDKGSHDVAAGGLALPKRQQKLKLNLTLQRQMRLSEMQRSRRKRPAALHLLKTQAPPHSNSAMA